MSRTPSPTPIPGGDDPGRAPWRRGAGRCHHLASLDSIQSGPGAAVRAPPWRAAAPFYSRNQGGEGVLGRPGLDCLLGGQRPSLSGNRVKRWSGHPRGIEMKGEEK